MAAIDADQAHDIFDAIEKIREFLPEAAALVELAFPTGAPLIAAAEPLLSALFELVVTLEAHPDRDAAAEALKARTDTLAAWHAILSTPLP